MLPVDSLTERYLTWTTNDFAVGVSNWSAPEDEIAYSWHPRQEPVGGRYTITKETDGFIKLRLVSQSLASGLQSNRKLVSAIPSNKNVETIVKWRAEIKQMAQLTNGLVGIFSKQIPAGSSPNRSVALNGNGGIQAYFFFTDSKFYVQLGSTVVFAQTPKILPPSGEKCALDFEVALVRGTLTYARFSMFLNGSRVAATGWVVDAVNNYYDLLFTDGVGFFFYNAASTDVCWYLYSLIGVKSGVS